MHTQQAHAQPVLRQLPLPRGAGAQKDAVRGRGVVEHGVPVLLGLLRRALRVGVGLLEPVAALRVSSHLVPGFQMMMTDAWRTGLKFVRLCVYVLLCSLCGGWLPVRLGPAGRRFATRIVS